MFSGFYLALVLMLFALILRGVAFEFRGKSDDPRWRLIWDWAIFAGSLVPALLWGVAVANLMLGVPIDGKMNYVGGFWNLLNPYALLSGVTFVALFLLHGALFLSLKTEGEVLSRARAAASALWLPTVILVVLFVIGGYLLTDLFSRLGGAPVGAVLIAALALLAAGWLQRAAHEGWAFGMTGLTIAMATAAVFAGLFPRVMISSLDPRWSLTIYTASSSPYTLQVMTIVAVIFVPIVLLYQGWTYWIFRKRVARARPLEY